MYVYVYVGEFCRTCLLRNPVALHHKHTASVHLHSDCSIKVHAQQASVLKGNNCVVMTERVHDASTVEGRKWHVLLQRHNARRRLQCGMEENTSSYIHLKERQRRQRENDGWPPPPMPHCFSCFAPSFMDVPPDVAFVVSMQVSG